MVNIFSSSEFIGFLKNEKLMIIKGVAQYYIFVDNFCIKEPLVLKIPLVMFFDSRNPKMTSNLL